MTEENAISEYNETKQRFGDIATMLQAVLVLKDVFIQVVSSEQGGRFTKITAKMSPSDIKWLRENKCTISKEIGSDSIRVVELDDGVVSIEVGLPFEQWKDLSYHGVGTCGSFDHKMSNWQYYEQQTWQCVI